MKISYHNSPTGGAGDGTADEEPKSMHALQNMDKNETKQVITYTTTV